MVINDVRITLEYVRSGELADRLGVGTGSGGFALDVVGIGTLRRIIRDACRSPSSREDPPYTSGDVGSS
jgi:hypothetical protein